jgi:hypothetical protein
MKINRCLLKNYLIQFDSRFQVLTHLQWKCSVRGSALTVTWFLLYGHEIPEFGQTLVSGVE